MILSFFLGHLGEVLKIANQQQPIDLLYFDWYVISNNLSQITLTRPFVNVSIGCILHVDNYYKHRALPQRSLMGQHTCLTIYNFFKTVTSISLSISVVLLTMTVCMRSRVSHPCNQVLPERTPLSLHAFTTPRYEQCGPTFVIFLLHVHMVIILDPKDVKVILTCNTRLLSMVNINGTVGW